MSNVLGKSFNILITTQFTSIWYLYLHSFSNAYNVFDFICTFSCISDEIENQLNDVFANYNIRMNNTCELLRNSSCWDDASDDFPGSQSEIDNYVI